MANGGDYYATLEVRPDADARTLKSAYRKLMQRYHPDVSASVDTADQCKKINEAYACLRDPRRRATYDARRRAHQRARRGAFSPTPGNNRMSTWNPTFAENLDLQDGLTSRRSKLLRAFAAILLTIATFAATSWINLPATPASGSDPATPTR